MVKFVIKFLLAIVYIPIFLAIFSPVVLPIYVIVMFFIIAYKIARKLSRKFYNYFVRDAFELAKKMIEVQDLLLVDNPRPNRTPDFLIPHGKSLIEVFRAEEMYRVFNGNGRDVGKNYLKLNDAKEEIDEMEPLLAH